jgi:hypothetical protein
MNVLSWKNAIMATISSQPIASEQTMRHEMTMKHEQTMRHEMDRVSDQPYHPFERATHRMSDQPSGACVSERATLPILSLSSPASPTTLRVDPPPLQTDKTLQPSASMSSLVPASSRFPAHTNAKPKPPSPRDPVGRSRTFYSGRSLCKRLRRIISVGVHHLAATKALRAYKP